MSPKNYYMRNPNSLKNLWENFPSRKAIVLTLSLIFALPTTVQSAESKQAAPIKSPVAHKQPEANKAQTDLEHKKLRGLLSLLLLKPGKIE